MHTVVKSEEVATTMVKRGPKNKAVSEWEEEEPLQKAAVLPSLLYMHQDKQPQMWNEMAALFAAASHLRSVACGPDRDHVEI